MSCRGYGQHFDANGAEKEYDTYSCDEADWFGFICKYSGKRCSTFFYHGDEKSFDTEDFVDFSDIIYGADKAEDAADCEFDENDYINHKGKIYYFALNEKNFLRVNEELYEISDSDRKNVYKIIRKYIPNWREPTL